MILNNICKIILLFSLSILIACKYRDKENNVEKAVSQQLILDSLKTLEDNHIVPDSSKNKLFFLVDTSCPVCINKINKFNDISKKNKEIDFYIICFSNDNFLYYRQLLRNENVETNNIISMFDYNSSFYDLNRDIKLSPEYLILTNQNNKVLKLDIPFDESKINELLNKM